MTDTKLNDTQAAILGLLHDGQAHGGEIVDVAEKWMPYFSVTRSQIYRELKAMTTTGLVREGKAGPRLKQPYQITAAGKRAFKAWMVSEPALDPIRNTMALRQAFAGLIPGDDMVDIKGQFIALHTAALNEINDRLKEAHEEGLWNDGLALKFAAAYHEAALNWLS